MNNIDWMAKMTSNMNVYRRNQKEYPFKSRSEIINAHRLVNEFCGAPVIRDSTKGIYKELK